MADDLELKAMSDIASALSGLDEDVVGRVLRWAADRYKVVTTSGNGRRSEEPEGGQDSDRQFDDFPSLYDAANPRNAVERALVAAYWFQVVEGNPDFDSFSLNRELKHLGHPSTNITRDLDGLIGRTPRLVMQVRKSGSSKQARKRYKVTTEGQRAVKRMLDGDSMDG